MKKFQLVASFCVFSLVVVSVCAAIAQTGRPRQQIAAIKNVPAAFFPELRFEFEPVDEGVVIKHDFIVENRGDAPLVIKDVRPD